MEDRNRQGWRDSRSGNHMHLLKTAPGQSQLLQWHTTPAASLCSWSQSLAPSLRTGPVSRSWRNRSFSFAVQSGPGPGSSKLLGAGYARRISGPTPVPPSQGLRFKPGSPSGSCEHSNMESRGLHSICLPTHPIREKGSSLSLQSPRL